MLAALTRNWELKILAAGLAVVVWFFVVNATHIEIRLDVTAGKAEERTSRG